ncbi:MAG: 30S ribosomal protein S12 methylthiotransferase RimO [Candidatus Aminicenantes bacterium]|nr:30S ribosomal protein S12 methylthiotransferase RimO [Candidatus Aminicenantes bacterium]
MPLSHRRLTAALTSYGCAKNLVDSEVMLGCLRRAGYHLTIRPERADVLILNTCGFIRPARDEAEEAIRSALALKLKERNKTVLVAGCYVERCRADLERRYPEVDVWLGVKDFDHIVEAVEGRPYRRGRKTFLLGPETPRLLSTPRSWAYLKISEGCSHECAFCAIPMIKGPYRSRSMSSIIVEARKLGARGVKEINLISQDTTYFGRDRGRKDGLVALLRRLIEVPGIGWIRMLYGYPEEVTSDLLDVMKEDKICSYLDIPFQHSDRRLLRAMKRAMEGKRALRLIERARRALPDVAIRTSLVVGFPGEGKREFAGLKEFVREARLDHLGVFIYSPEKGTDAFALGDPVPEKTKIRRREEIMAIQSEIVASIQRKYLHERLAVLIDPSVAAAGALIVGRARFQAPEVDGVVLVEGGLPRGRSLRAIEQVEIISTAGYDLRGRFIE